MRESAHPRSRGENLPPPTCSAALRGSSPLTRGKHSPLQSGSRSSRLIPAHAGKTTTRTHIRTPAPAHPRSRGENSAMSVSDISPYGSSPLTRGKLAGHGDDHGRIRLIPAHAGKTFVADGVHFSVPAHPRSRGENGVLARLSPPPPGSSPLTRGKPKDSWLGNIDTRLIPAHAGKTAGHPHLAGVRGAHPRSRGENSRVTWGVIVRDGSSPLTRGKPRMVRVPRRRRGLIPAHAGKTGDVMRIK